MGWNAMRLHGNEKKAVSLTYYWSWDEMQWECMVKKKSSVPHSLLFMEWNAMRLHGDSKRSSVTHILLVMGWDAMRPHGNRKRMSVTHSLLVMGWNAMRMHGNRSSVTHILLVMGWDSMRLHGKEKKAVSLTFCWSRDEMQWDCMIKKKKQCYSHPVSHGMKCNETAW